MSIPPTRAILGILWIYNSYESSYQDPEEQACLIMKQMVLDSMNRRSVEDLNQDKLTWIIKNIDELFMEMEENQNDIY